MMRTAFCILCVSLVTLVSCSKGGVTGPVQVSVIRPTGSRCGYEFGTERLSTLQDISTLKGSVGQIITSSKTLSAEDLSAGNSFTPIDTEFTESGGVYYPVDMQSLFAGSLYFAIEKSYLTLRNLDSRADLATLNSSFSDTRIVLNARRIETEQSHKEVHDNAEYLPVEPASMQGQGILTNYFFAYPTETIKGIPLGLNLGIMAHEYSHMVFQYLFYNPGEKNSVKVASAGKPTFNTLAAVDEGIADYIGFYLTKDPDYFKCSFPQENRGLAEKKVFTSQIISGLNSGGDAFDSHEGGAVWASMLYEVGQTLGSHEIVAKSLIQFMSYILSCPRTQGGTNSISLDFSDLAACHLDSLKTVGGDINLARPIYQKYLGTYGSRL